MVHGRGVGLAAAGALLAAALAGAPANAADAPCTACRDSLGRSALEPPVVGLTGTLARAGGGWELTGCAGRTTLTGDFPMQLEPLAGRRVWVKVRCDAPDSAHALGGHALGDSVVDLFVMGLCPFARELEGAIAADLARGDSLRRPPIRLHFLFYATDSAGMLVVRSLHGPRELVENVVQMAVQELEPARLWRYLAARSADPNADWATLARDAGLSWRTLAEIERRVDVDAQDLARSEWRRVSADWPYVDGSPTVYWLGAEVRSLSAVPGFARAKGSQGHCPH